MEGFRSFGYFRCGRGRRRQGGSTPQAVAHDQSEEDEAARSENKPCQKHPSIRTLILVQVEVSGRAGKQKGKIEGEGGKLAKNRSIAMLTNSSDQPIPSPGAIGSLLIIPVLQVQWELELAPVREEREEEVLKEQKGVRGGLVACQVVVETHKLGPCGPDGVELGGTERRERGIRERGGEAGGVKAGWMAVRRGKKGDQDGQGPRRRWERERRKPSTGEEKEGIRSGRKKLQAARRLTCA